LILHQGKATLSQ